MKKAIRITEAEWEVMSFLWVHAPAPASQIADALEKRKHWTLTTVRTLLRRLVNKGIVAQQLEGKRYLYTPRMGMDECVRRESESFLGRVLGRAPASALLHLVEGADLSSEDIKELRRILREKEK